MATVSQSQKFTSWRPSAVLSASSWLIALVIALAPILAGCEDSSAHEVLLGEPHCHDCHDPCHDRGPGRGRYEGRRRGSRTQGGRADQVVRVTRMRMARIPYGTRATGP